MRIQETCGCGARVEIDEQMAGYASLAAGKWRKQHACTVVPPGPCGHDPGVVWPNGNKPRCELRAGHEGAHECDRGAMGGTATWVETDSDDAEQRAERAEAAEQDAQADCDRRGERLWRLATEAGWRPGNDADNDATAETHIRERLRDAERAEAELAALRERVRDRAWAFDAMGRHAHAEGLRDLLDDDTTGAASGEGEK